MTMDYNVAVVGATGAVGESLLEILADRNFPIGKINMLASARSVGKYVRYNGRSIAVSCLDDFDFNDTHIALFSAGGSVSDIHAPRAAKAGAIVVDNTSRFRREAHIPLVVPEVNRHRIKDGIEPGIIANPNCSTIQMVVALKPIYDAVGIRRINVCTYQAVSGAGAKGMSELAQQTTAILNAKSPEVTVAPVQIAFNAVPQIAEFQENGYTFEEMKMVWETKKIFEDESIQVNPTCVRIPVFVGHSEAVHIETRDKISTEHVRELLRQTAGVKVVDKREPGGYPTAALDGANNDFVYVGRIREDISHPNGINMWIVSDNVRKGAALNSVQIAEELVTIWN